MVVMPVRSGILPRDERSASGGATGLAVVVGENRASFGQAIDVRRASHHAVRVSADIPHTDIVAPDDEDVGFLLFCALRQSEDTQCQSEGQCKVSEILHSWSPMCVGAWSL